MISSKHDCLVGTTLESGVKVLERVAKPKHLKKEGVYFRCECPVCKNDDWVINIQGLKKTKQCKKCLGHTKESFEEIPDYLVGQIFERLTVLKFDSWYKPFSSSRRPKWLCKCHCGNETVVHEIDLRRGDTKSCGCLNKERIVEMGKANLKDETGNRFGRLVVLELFEERTSHRGTRYRCLCDCGNEAVVNGDSLRTGNTKSCGCLQNENQSSGAQMIQNYFEKHQIPFNKEQVFVDLLSPRGRPLRFDFAVLNQDETVHSLIEFDGIQHFQYRPFFHKTYEDFTYLQKCDRLKNEYCAEQCIPLLRISYHQENSIPEIVKKFLDSI